MPRTSKALHLIINDRSYWLNFVVTWEGNNYRYVLIQCEQADLLSDFLPRELHFDKIDGEVVFDERLHTEEGREIAEVIWEIIAAGKMT